MRKLSIWFDTNKIKIPDNEKEALAKFGYQAFFEPIFNHALQAKYPQGVPLKTGRILARIQNNLDELEVGKWEILLEEAEFDLIKEVFTSESVGFPPQQYRIVTAYVWSIEHAEQVKEPVEAKK